jgi:hypothetical protein
MGSPQRQAAATLAPDDAPERFAALADFRLQIAQLESAETFHGTIPQLLAQRQDVRA